MQDIVTALVLTPVRWAKGRGYLRHFRGDVGIDTTATPVFARPTRTRRSTGEPIASTELTAGWHHSADNGPPEYGYSATLTVAARTRSVLGSFPQLALGLVLDTPHKRIGANAISRKTHHPCRSAPLTVGFAMPNGRISPPTSGLTPPGPSQTPAPQPPNPGRTRFGTPRNDKIPPDRDDQTGSRQPQSSRFKNGPWWGVHKWLWHAEERLFEDRFPNSWRSFPAQPAIGPLHPARCRSVLSVDDAGPVRSASGIEGALVGVSNCVTLIRDDPIDQMIARRTERGRELKTNTMTRPRMWSGVVSCRPLRARITYAPTPM
ncbi:hypothetical protein [Nonomuraea aurantiaca]|uniref:hypothetical protein n=1 Tax=Nonomuraea aurantiaca TaxID=2878562 RepID=UPI001CD97C49|nr:hypothetical protein [Nonomuraea aurantiaca]MCA2225656.1 hypothetical protein [Nonomuraea aurantiaca]